MIKQGSTVKVHYTGKLANGVVFDSSLQREPLEFKIGEGKIIEGFEAGVIGLSVGDKASVDIEPAKAYGEMRRELVVTVPKTNVPEGTTVGQALQTAGSNGQPVTFIVKEIKENDVVLDANHPLAGQNLHFDIEVLDVN